MWTSLSVCESRVFFAQDRFTSSRPAELPSAGVLLLCREALLVIKLLHSRTLKGSQLAEKRLLNMEELLHLTRQFMFICIAWKHIFFTLTFGQIRKENVVQFWSFWFLFFLKKVPWQIWLELTHTGGATFGFPVNNGEWPSILLLKPHPFVSRLMQFHHPRFSFNSKSLLNDNLLLAGRTY